MGTPFATMLKTARGRRKLSALAHTGKIAKSTLSEYENDRACPSPPMLPKLAQAYGVSLDELTRLWAAKKMGPDAAEAGIGGGGQVPSARPASMIESLQRMKELHSTTGEVLEQIEKIHTVAHGLVHALAPKRETIPVGGTDPRGISASDDGWTAVCGNVNWKRRTLFIAKNPAPLLAELHQVAPRFGSLHCQPQKASRSPYFEIWSVVQGEGVLLIEQGESRGKWQEFTASVGTCGSYCAADRHVWINAHSSELLVLFYVFYPYRSPDREDQMIGFSMEEIREKLPADVVAAIQGTLERT